MAVKYIPIDGEFVSEPWFIVVMVMRRQGVHGNVNEGHRTMARQWYFYNLYRSGQGNLAAYPSANAPHIRTGRLDHAIDFGNDAAVFNWLQRNGLRPVRTVRGESWHIECPASALIAFANRHRTRPYDKLDKNERFNVSRLFYHRKGLNKYRGAKTAKGKKRYASHLKWARYHKAWLTKRANLLYKLWKKNKRYHRGERQALIRKVINTPSRTK